MTKPADPPKPRARGKLRQPQAYYDRLKQKFAEERDLRLDYRPEGTDQFTSELIGGLAKYSIDPYAQERIGNISRVLATRPADRKYKRGFGSTPE